MVRHLLAGMLLVLAACGGAWADSQITLVTPDWVAQHTFDPTVRVLDARPDLAEYLAGHVPNAVHLPETALCGPRDGVPMQYLPAAALADVFGRAGVKDGQTVVVYSDGINAPGATMLAYALVRIGYPQIAIMSGGWSAYKAALPAGRLYPMVKTERPTLAENAAVMATLDDMKTAITNAGVKIIDARPYAAYTGEAGTWVRNGHIPGAVNIGWQQFMDPTNPHRFRPPAEMQALLDAQGIRKTDTVIIYCSIGRASSLEYVALHTLLGYPNVRVYEGSWTEYCGHPELPVVEWRGR